MKDSECVSFMQWALPQMHMRWQGFRKVRRQVCKRITGRIKELQLPHVDAYRSYLWEHSAEWTVLDGMCRVTISRFFRDRGVCDALGSVVLPELARLAAKRGEEDLRCWSIGCASGEEAYTVSLLWDFLLAGQYPEIELAVFGTDIDQILLLRAEEGKYPASSLKDVPGAWLADSFTRAGGLYWLKREHRNRVRFIQEDIRRQAPAGFFHLILCRNLVFTYFDAELQGEILERIRKSLIPGGALVIGAHERLPEGFSELSSWLPNSPIYRMGHPKI
jgi:chemotaxis protein methyltransferase CheR